MGADQFLLTWNNHRSNFAEVFSQLRVQDQLVDVTLLCDGGNYPAHRLVLAACSPYFHQLFTRLPTQHPIVYLRDVKQAELEALLEFIYRGEVSVANSELTGLIKIAESLRIKGLGDVSQRDPAPYSRPLKRSSTPFSNSTSSRSKKPARTVNTCSEGIVKPSEAESISSILSSATNFGSLRPAGFSHLLENPSLAPLSTGADAVDHDSHDSCSPPPPFKDSKLRSCLEGQEPSIGGVPMNLLAPVATSRMVGGLLRREIENREALKKRSKKKLDTSEPEFSNSDQDKDEKNIFNEIKQENMSGDEPSSPIASGNQSEQDSSLLLPQFPKLYESGDLGNSFLTKYTQLLSSFHQQQLQTQMPPQSVVTQPNHVDRDEESPSFSSLIPTTVQEQHQISPTPKDAKSLTCQLCGATIKHIANFRRHMKQHLNPRRFPCPWCSAAFGRKDNLKTHTRKHHPVEVEAQEQNLSLPLNEGQDDDHQDAEHEDENDCESHVVNGLNESSSPAPNDDDDSGADQNDDSLIIADDEDDDKGDEMENGNSS